MSACLHTWTAEEVNKIAFMTLDIKRKKLFVRLNRHYWNEMFFVYLN